MNYPDDQTPPSTPPFGGETGDIFATGDVISDSPTTAERVVDTQSGYLVVLKRVDKSRVSLSVKRRVGTPPGSSIVLTPDEQVKMSKILAEAKTGFPTAPATPRPSPRAQQFNDSLSTKTRSGASDDLFLGDAPEKEFARVQSDREVEWALDKANRGMPPFNRAQVVGAIATAVIVPVFVIVGIGKLFQAKPFSHATAVQTAPTAPVVSEDAKVDKFVRGFVADMLDFDATTYRGSQIRAMSQMSPDLLNRYWDETHFPLSPKQLAGTPKGQTMLITKVTQQPGPDGTHNVDLFAELATPNSRISTPVHLALKVGSSPDQQFRVIDQKDVSTK